MSIRRLVTVLCIGVCFSIFGATIKLPVLKVGPVTYNDVVVIGANATDLYFTHANGIGNVKLKYLSKELQTKFNYDAKSAAEAEKKQMEADALYQSHIVSNLVAQVKDRREEKTNVQETLQDPVSDKSLLGKIGPKIELEQWTGDVPETAGKHVLVCFWAPWSTASRSCVPELNALQKKFADKLVLVGVTPTALGEEDLSVEPKPTFASGTDPKVKLAAAVGIRSIPFVLLMDPQGLVLYEGHPAALTEKKLQTVFARAVE